MMFKQPKAKLYRKGPVNDLVVVHPCKQLHEDVSVSLGLSQVMGPYCYQHPAISIRLAIRLETLCPDYEVL